MQTVNPRGETGTQSPTSGDEDGIPSYDTGVNAVVPEAVKKTSSERIGDKLIRNGWEEESVFRMSRPELLSAMTQLSVNISDTDPWNTDLEMEVPIANDMDLQMRQLELRERELRFQDRQLDMQFEMQRMQNEVRLEELRVKDERDKVGLDMKKEKFVYQQKQEDSLTARTKRYSDALKNVYPACLMTYVKYLPTFNWANTCGKCTMSRQTCKQNY